MLNLNNCLIDAEKSELAYQIAIVQLHMANVLLSLGKFGCNICLLYIYKCNSANKSYSLLWSLLCLFQIVESSKARNINKLYLCEF